MCIRDRYNPRSNGLAEAAVKNVKQLLEKCVMQGECFESALYSWRNMPRGESKSPVELLFGRKQRTALPTLARHHQQIDIDAAAKKKDMTYERAKTLITKARQSTASYRWVRSSSCKIKARSVGTGPARSRKLGLEACRTTYGELRAQTDDSTYVLGIFSRKLRAKSYEMSTKRRSDEDQEM